MAAPTLIASAIAAFTTEKAVGVATANTTSALTLQSGDVLVALMAGEDSVYTGALSASGSVTGAYTSRRSDTTASHCSIAIYSATAAGTGSETGTVTRGATTSVSYFGGAFLQFRGSAGIGAVMTAALAQSSSITTTQDNSAVALVIADWDATNTATRTWPNVNGAQPSEVSVGLISGRYGWAVAYYADVGAAGAKTIGLSTPTLGTPQILAIEIKGAIPTQISQVPGAYSWSGTTATTNQVLSAIFGAWQWVGTTATVTQLIAQASGSWAWAGTTASITQLVNAAPGTWTWDGSTAATTQLLNATPGAWSWVGTTAEVPTQVSATPGVWSWLGTTANFGGATVVSATAGAYSWSGTNAEIPQQISATPGIWTWQGTTAATTQLIGATAGAWGWAGTTAAVTQTLDATPGGWVWTGVSAQVLQLVSVDAAMGTWAWIGTTAGVSQPGATTEVVGGWAKFRRKPEPDDDEETRASEDAVDIVAEQPRERIRGTIRLSDIVGRLERASTTEADDIEARARARAKRKRQRGEEILLLL